MPKQLYDIRNYPRRSGTSQPQRYNAELMGEKVKIEENTIADYIVFAYKFSAYLKYYNETNKEAGNWQNFLIHDVSFHLAVAATDKSKYWEETWAELMENIEATPATLHKEYKKYFTWRYDFLYSLVGRLVDTYINSKPLPSWNDELKALFLTSNLNIIYELLQNYYNSSTNLLIEDSLAYTFKNLELERKQTIATRLETIPEIFNEILKQTDLPVDDTDFIFGDHTPITEKIDAASEYLDDLARQLMLIISRVNRFN